MRLDGFKMVVKSGAQAVMQAATKEWGQRTCFLIMLISMAGLTACVNANANTAKTSDGNKTTIEMELNKNYDDKDPFVNEKLFCVSGDLDALSAGGTLKMDGESLIVEVKNNRTNEVLWSNTWEKNKLCYNKNYL